MKKIIVSIVLLLFAVTATLSAAAEGQVLAFPGAMGGGKYSPGARGILEENGTIEVYHVTNLNDSGAGSLRDGVSKAGRIIVFDVSGTIELKTQLLLKQSNITILAQTAPGDGITLSGADVTTDDGVKNIIIRYLKVRPTDKNSGEPDGLGGRFGTNIIFDHCSVSWCVDELLTLYAGPGQSATEDKPWGSNLTIQNTIGSESLRMSNHFKGAHGYGAIWGGTNSSYVYNLLAHHDSRSPRMDRQLQKTQVSGNVIYDWGQTNSAYGAEPYSSDKSQKLPSLINWTGNYYKAGPATASKLLTRIFDVTGPSDEDDPMSQFYFNDNYIFGVGTVADYQNNAYVNNFAGAQLLDSPTDMGDYYVEPMTSEAAYEYVLNNAGATLPRRDPIDARIINDVKNGTGRLINNASEVGGLIPVEEEQRKFEIPAQWLTDNGLAGMNETDIITDGKFAGYTLIEAYVNDWTEDQSKITPTNPDIVVHSPSISSLSTSVEGMTVNNGEWTVITEGETVAYKATAIAVGGNDVTKMELYDRNTKIGEFEGSSIDTEITLEAGTHYLTCRAYNTRGEKTQSTFSIVYVKAAEAPGSYSFAEIRENKYTGYKGKGGASMDEKGVYTVYGSGRINDNSASDNCGFMYKEVTGDFDVTVKVEEVPKFENQQVNGLMVRSDLSNNSVMAMIGDGWIKYGENVRVFTRTTKGAKSSETYFKTADGTSCENTDSLSYTMPKYMRIQRTGDTLTFSVSNTGAIWTDNDRQPMTVKFPSLPETMYVGLATDSANGISVKEYFSAARFSHLTLNGESDVIIEEGSVPFYDTSFDASEHPEWYIENGSGNKDLSGTGLGGNFGEALLFWGNTYRTFNSQNEGIVSITADFYTRAHSTSVNNKAGARFMLAGADGSGNYTKIKSIYAQHKDGFFIDYDETDSNPAVPPESENIFELEQWYKVEMKLDYYTGLGTFDFKPYTEYNSLTETYTAGDPIFSYEFEFDTSVALNTIDFVRRGGYEMYLDNVGVDVYIKQILYKDGDNVVVDAPPSDGVLYIVSYDENGALTNAAIHSVTAGETAQFDISGGQKAFLWDNNMSPLCKPIEL